MDERPVSIRKATAVNAQYTPIQASPVGYKSFKAFYPFYLGEHNNKICRRLHIVGTSVSILTLTRIALSFVPALVPHQPAANGLRLPVARWKIALAALAQGYFFAWVGHFFFENNKPATFKYPVYSFIGDLRLWWEFVTLQRDV